MKTDVVLFLETLMEYCHERWTEADETTPSTFPTADVLTGKKMAYNDVLQFARQQVADLAERR